MAENFKTWTMTSAGIVVFGSMCEMILPSGNFQKYIRLIIGMMLILALASPIYGLLNMNFSLEHYSEDSISAYTDMADMEERQKRDIINAYKAKLAEKMLASLQQNLDGISADIRCEVEEHDAETFGSVIRVTVILDADCGENITDGIRKALNSDYGISKDKIAVRYLKE